MTDRPAGGFDCATLAAALDRNGGDLARWPAALAAQAEALAARDPAARQDIERAARLEGLIGTLARPQPLDAATIGLVVSGLHDRHRRRERAREHIWRATPRFALASIAGLTLCAMVGLGLGYVAPVPGETGTSVAANTSNQDIATALLGFDPGESL
ncbi:hypothetical protein [Segnochrobactrum spirostomi]|uniref:Uncharacterized protein n=1 Tax=Segnochrobactrum spirostomi TaxID=2608987 RepID=A0A6A7Y5M2_9HYPH|nr:hypothetical protein [Segnochrobactrum spirostomi]MQT12992.1 hypothetical protein [Segnochrobactrum spirostomi]